MTFNLARPHDQFLSWLNNKCNMYLKYILDNFSEYGHRKEDLSIFTLFWTQLTFDLILRPQDISRLGIHPYRFYYTYRKYN